MPNSFATARASTGAPTSSENQHASPGPKVLKTVRVATWNTLHGRIPHGPVDLAAFARTVRAFDADVIGLQEVDRRQRRSHWVDMASLAGEEAELHVHFVPARRRWDFGLYGNALLSHYPAAVEGIRLGRSSWRSERRSAVRAEIANWTFVTTHLSLKLAESAQQLAVLLDDLAQVTGPAVLFGDLNRQPDELAAIVRTHGFVRIDTPPTFPAHSPSMTLDHVLVRGAEATHVEVRPAPVSDHAALIIDIRAAK